MYAYNEIYLDDAMKNLGEAFDYAVNVCGKSADEFANLFVASGLAEDFSKGNPKYVAGMSGTELFLDVIVKTGTRNEISKIQIEYDASPEYWSGWILAYYQWKSGKSFKDIFSTISMEDILKLYPALHEAAEDKFVDTINSIMARQDKVSKLQLQRKIYGYSQRELAEEAGVNIRTLQQYELGTKDIGKASVSTVIALARVLGCRVEDLL